MRRPACWLLQTSHTPSHARTMASPGRRGMLCTSGSDDTTAGEATGLGCGGAGDVTDNDDDDNDDDRA